MFFKSSLLNKELKKASLVSYFKNYYVFIVSLSIWEGKSLFVIHIFQNVLAILALFFQIIFKIT